MIIYVDGIFDLFHAGHVNTLKYIKNMEKDVYIIVGLISDRVAESYKRKPIICEENRKTMLDSCIYIDKVISNVPLIINKEFIIENKIDLVVHSYSDNNDENKQDNFFKIPKELGKYKTIPYSTQESTTKIINKIKDL
jgi:choline-phosphate cytidylyltransferase|tara:strand:- start:35 stop:448 length:414 start_codon:yes stop_codon:yes gene_type:complete